MKDSTKVKIFDVVVEVVQMMYLIASFFAVPILTIPFQNWVGLFFGVNFVLFQFAFYWMRREKYRLESRLEK